MEDMSAHPFLRHVRLYEQNIQSLLHIHCGNPSLGPIECLTCPSVSLPAILGTPPSLFFMDSEQ